jgi:replicative DNA helicase
MSVRNKFGVLTGYSGLDSLTGGLRNSDLVLLACPEEMGRLTFLLSIALKSFLEFDSKIGIISLDRSAELIRKYIPQFILEKPFNEIEFSTLNADQLSTLKQIQEEHLLVVDKSTIQLPELLDQCNTLKYDNNISLIIINSLELIRSTADNDTIPKKDIVRSLKTHAKALDIPILLASDLPILADSHEFQPTLERLNSYGTFGDYADQILFLYRPEYYGIDFDAEGNSYKGGNIIILAKSRYGRKGEVMMKYNQCCTRFDEF